MTTRPLEELDGGLGSCRAGEDLSALADPYSGRARENTARGAQAKPGRTQLEDPAGMPSLADLSSRPQDSPAGEGGVDTKPKKIEKEPAVKRVPSPGKEKTKAGATPRSAPARKKTQSVPPAQPPPPPPSDELPWGDVTLNKCLVLASLVALLGSACQLCHGEHPAGHLPVGNRPWASDVVIGKEAVEPWVPPSPAPKVREPPPVRANLQVTWGEGCGAHTTGGEGALTLGPLSVLQPKPTAWVPPPAPPAPPEPQEEAEARPEAPGSGKAAVEDEEAGKTTEETPGEAQAEQEHKEKLPGRERRRKEERQRKEKEQRPRKERPRREKEARPRKERPRPDQMRRGEREGSHWPRARDSADPQRGKGPAWEPRRRGRSSSSEERPARPKHRADRGRD
ncbi:PREDICTED: junctional sarcoplasmic reticulum protein 1 [Elephantulus edwardii]|uniref:junctional sarcoplasmic reticulum protein 1 n=1 Tax=Elephantulus edwardii TaxID=28737 RepID=UPI0003F0E9D5|nr:PREDICTED: junctional sarcoplasmic reticulum protein 1 [Elephantulus edwardii]